MGILWSDSLFTCCSQQEISVGYLGADRRTKRVRQQIPAEALVTSMAMDFTPTCVQPSYKRDWVKEGG